MKYQVFKKLAGLMSAVSLSFASVTGLSAQEPVQVSGAVSDETGGPVPGVVVMVKGTTHGTTTDGNGEFSFQIGGGMMPYWNFHVSDMRQ